MKGKRWLTRFTLLLAVVLAAGLAVAEAPVETVVTPGMGDVEMVETVVAPATEAAGSEETALAPEAEQAVVPHNYIMLIDNSRSTTGRHSLGGATDPKGLRFDAAKLVYQNVASSVATGAQGQLAVIVFCGTKNCVCYGPMDITDDALDDVIGSKLNEASNAKWRDDYTDIRTALEKARDVMRGFEGNTSVILLTDGVNDLTNRSNPFSRPENIEANKQSAALVKEMHDAGADFYVIALTAEEEVANTEAFMVFINELAEAGGKADRDGDSDNVLVATEGDLNSKLVQMLIKAESASESIQTIVEHTPMNAPFDVPYAGIVDATVNITFMPEDKPLLEQVRLVAPDGSSYALWDRSGSHEQGGISVTESRSYIMLRIPSPAEGKWSVVVTSRNKANTADAGVLINAVVRFNHNLRLRVKMDDVVQQDSSARIEAWFQSFDGENFDDFKGSDIYAQSEAELTVTTPSGKQKTVKMKLNGDRYVVAFRAKTAGTWTAQVKISNPYVQETTDEMRFEVIPVETPAPAPDETIDPDETFEPEASDAPTPEPTPTPTPTPKIEPIEDVEIVIEPSVTTEAGETFLVPGEVSFSWEIQQETDAVEAALTRDGKSIGQISSGMTFQSDFFKEGPEYGVRISAMPKNGELVGMEPTVFERAFRATPLALEEGDITLEALPHVEDSDDMYYVDRNAEKVTLKWKIDRPTDAVEARLLEDGKPIIEGLESGDAVERSKLKDGAQYELVVTAKPLFGDVMDLEPLTVSLPFRVYPEPEPIVGLTVGVSNAKEKKGVYNVKTRAAELYWSCDSGDIDHYGLTVNYQNGEQIASETLPGGTTGYSLWMPRDGDYTVALSAVPRYAPEGASLEVKAEPVTVHSMSLLEKYWYYLAGGVALLAALITIILVNKKNKNVKHVAGSVRVTCEALDLDKTLTLTDDKKGVKVGDPITRHPELAKLRGKKAYQLLQNVRLNNARTDRDGRAPLEDDTTEVQHRPTVRVVSLTYTDPVTKQTTVRYVGLYDVGTSTIHMQDSSGMGYDFVFSGEQ